MMLLGESRREVDDERLTLPAEFCEALGGEIAVTRGIERCLFIYPIKEWQKIVERISRLPITSQVSRSFARLFLSGALTHAPGAEHQVPLPDDLRRYADIENDAVFVGLGTHLEVWSPQRWREVKAQIIKRSEEVAENLELPGYLDS